MCYDLERGRARFRYRTAPGMDINFTFDKEFAIGVILMVDSQIRILPYEFTAQEIEKYMLIQME